MNQKQRDELATLRETLMNSETRMYEHVTTTFRWLMATLFTANGGAIVALLNHPELGSRRVALACFAVGLILALLMAALSTFLSYRSSLTIMAARMQVEHGLIIDQVPQEAIDDFTDRQKPTWKTWMPSAVGIASLLCFISGAAFVGAALIH